MDRVQHQLTAAALAILAACSADRGTARAAPPAVVDSILPREVTLTRFREGMAEVTALTGGAPSRDALVHRFVRAVERADTADLREQVLTRAEFAWLYYPTNPQGLPPYDLSPGLMWEMLSLESDRGLRRALADFGGQRLAYGGASCDQRTSRQGENTVVGPCAVRLGVGADTQTVRLFGLIIERAGVHKFVSYAND